jgi:hypothetical protein
MFGFENLTGKASCKDYYVDSTQANRSHDLRLLSDFIQQYIPARKRYNLGMLELPNELIKLLRKLVYGQPYERRLGCGAAAIDRYYGTQQADDSYPTRSPNVEDIGTTDFKNINTRIQTVYDAFVALCDVITSPRFFSSDDNND